MINYTFSVEELEFFLLVFVRVTCFIFSAPFFSMTNTPKRVRIALGVFVSYLIYQSLIPHEAIEYNGILEYSIIIVKEGITGLLVGFSANICNSIVLFAGRIVDMDIGLSMASQFDPTTKENGSITGIFYQYTVMLILLMTNMHQFIIKALVETYQLIPVNHAFFNGNKILDAMIMYMTDFFSIGFRICLPVFCVILIVNVLLGILARVSPQLNMFAVGMQIKILIGFGVLFLTVGMLPYVSDYIYKEMKVMMVSFVEAMM